MVYILDIDSKPLMPTTNVKARLLLKNQKAKIVKLKPFTIQLIYRTSTYTQNVTLGIDSGYNNIGFSATTEKKEIISGEIKLLQGMSNRISKKAMYRRTRRSKTRYRKPRFLNRRIKKGWLAPSIQHKYDSHIRFIDKLKKILPITKIVVEVAAFDIQKIKNPKISGIDYQQGEQLGFWNTREYVLYRDNHKCQNPNCKNRKKNQILEVHHIVFQSNSGTNKPSNLITLCTNCHTSPNHKKGKFLNKWQTIKPRLKSFKDATFMNIVRWKLINKLKELYPNLICKHTYGYITKSNRISLKIKKSHYNDAFVISDGKKHIRIKPILFEQIKRNNRCLEKFYDAKYINIRTGKKTNASELNNGRATRNKNKNSDDLKIFRGIKISKGRRNIRKQRFFYQPGDLVKYMKNIFTVRGTQNKGKYIALKELKKVVKFDLLTSYKFRKGFV